LTEDGSNERGDLVVETALPDGRKERGFRLAIDVGGTFTDCLVLDPVGDINQFKAFTTPDDPSLGFMEAVEKAAEFHELALQTFVSRIELVIHGTTLATNTLLTQSGASTGMITTNGFRDILEIRRGHKNVRTSMYNLFVPPYEPLIPRQSRMEATERTLYTGEVHTPLDEDEVRDAAKRLRDLGVDSVLVGFLHSYANPGHETRAAQIVRETIPGAHIVSSHEILPVWREWERFSSAAVSAYCGPRVERYFDALQTRLGDSGFGGTILMMLSDGLVETVEYCASRVVYLIGSGPAAAPAAAIYLGNTAEGGDDLISVDMGGTSFDVCMVRNGVVPTTTEGWIGDERIAIKMVDINTGGAGGGSIAWVDSLGLLRVGPRSAGGNPGPACYGRGGTEPTVTDADLLLGYIPADYFLGGEVALDPDRSEAAMKSVADELGMSTVQAAEAVRTTVDAYMADKITEVATRRGIDLRDFALVAGGGAGPVHAATIADLLEIPRVIIPPLASTYSAFGMFAMDVGRNYARSYIARSEDLDLDRINTLYQEMEADAFEGFAELGVDAADVSLKRTADMRYRGQFHEVEVSFPVGDVTTDAVDEAIANFHARHHELYTFNMPWQGVQFLTFRLRATTPRASFELKPAEAESVEDAALKRTRTCRWRGDDVETPVYEGARLRSGDEFDGPAIIEETTTTVVIPPRYSCSVDRYRNYILTRRDDVVDDSPDVTFVFGGVT
jgi:N-methylhydantoinase A